MACLRRADPALREYLMKHRIPDLIQSIFAALVVNQPESLPKFVIEKIDELENDPDLWINLRWDTFIHPDKKPKQHLNADLLGLLWSYEDDNFRPTMQQNSKAYQFHYTSLTQMCFRALKMFWLRNKRKRENLGFKVNEAREYYTKRVLRIHFQGWHRYSQGQLEKKFFLEEAIRKCYRLALYRLVFNAWRSVSLDSARTREYFEQLERGEMFEDMGEEPEKGATDLVTKLPIKLAVLIFSFIDLSDLITCCQVCRSWKVITQTNALWSKIDLTKVKDSFSNAFVINLFQKGKSFLCHLNLRGVNRISNKCLKAIGNCRNLQDLNISDCSQVTDDTIKEIALGCSSLLYLNVAQTGISDIALKSLSRYCSNIQFLNLAYCFNISERGLQYLANGRGRTNLLYLDLSACEQIGFHGYHFISSGCKAINTLIVNELPYLSDDCVKAFMKENKSLRVFSCLHSPHLNDSSLMMVMACRKLTTIKIEGNNQMTDASVKIMAKSCPDLCHVYLSSCVRLTDLSLKALGQCRCLVVVNMADCYRLSDVGVRYLAEGPSGNKIRELNLTNCVRVSDVSILRISQRCQSLTYANFSYCDHITDAGMELMGTIQSLISIHVSGCNVQDAGITTLGNNENLRDINLSDCSQVTDIGLQKLVINTKSLENLDISNCKLITDQGMKTLAFHCRKIRRLNVSGVVLLTDASLQYLSGSCPYLEELDISGCRNLSDKSMRYLKKGCRRLKSLTMLYCRGVTKSMGQKMGEKFPHVSHSQEEATPAIRFHRMSEEKVIVNY